MSYRVSTAEGSTKLPRQKGATASEILSPTAEELKKKALEEERQAKLHALLTGVTYKSKDKERSELKLTEVEDGQSSEVRKKLAHMKREVHRAEVLMQEKLKARKASGEARLEVRSMYCAVFCKILI